MEYIGESKYKEAVRELEKAVELDPANEDAKRFLKNMKDWMNVLDPSL
jgi:Tfp pilus assembly protein PilF